MIPLLTLAPERRLLHRIHPERDEPADEKAPFDLMAILGLTGVALGTVIFPFTVVGIIFSMVGMAHTKGGTRRSRKMAVAAFVYGWLVFVIFNVSLGFSLNFAF